MNRAGGSGGGDEWVERVREASDIVEVIGQTVGLKRVGRNMTGLCPFHNERTPSFSVHPERQFYHCFSCKAGGDVFKFVQETEKVGFLDAVELLSRRAGIPIPERRAGGTSVRGPLLDALEAAATAYQHWLADPERGASARSYLERRGLNREAIQDFRLGFVPAGWENLTSRLLGKFSEAVLAQAGLVGKRDGGRGGSYDRFRNRLMVPLTAPGGHVVGFGARALAAGDEPKYLNSPETPVYQKGSFLYGLDRARRAAEEAGEIVLVEGYFDCITLCQHGIRHVVATAGTSLTLEQARAIRRIVNRVCFTYDGDTAGREATMRSLSVLLGEGLEVLIADLPKGVDPDTLVREGGEKAWVRVREAAADPVVFIQRHVLEARESGDPRERALQALVRLANDVRDPVRLRLLLERASRVFGFPEEVLQRAVRIRRSGQRPERAIEAVVRERDRGGRHLEREFLQALLLKPDCVAEARRQVSPEDFHDAASAALARSLWSEGQEGGDDQAAAVLTRELRATALEGIDWGRVAHGGMKRMVRRRLERRYRDLQNRILELQRRGQSDDPETARLLEESQELAYEIRRSQAEELTRSSGAENP